ncbi:hypothetical protein HID58_041023 [Brassica napus]|uniref:Probable purine permease n=1 Tax=Brassica napus TaxID=3708 RepID=A0ABQ8B9P0_BRANA|nr:hypothetical protein HID58_041023 [Brassica napus]
MIESSQGILTDLSRYRSGSGWIDLDVRNTGLTLTGGGTFDRQGAVAWPFNNCKLLPASLKFVGMNRTIEPSKVKLSEIYFKNIRGTSSSRVAMEVESETQELHIHVNGEPERKSSTEQRSHNYSWRLRVSLYVILLLAGETIATLLGRLYYDKGGNSIWLETLVQLVGFPLTLPCYYYIKHESSSKNNNLTNKTTTSFLTLPLVYIGLGLLAAGHSVLYSFGLLYLPVSTFSLISASQLAFNAVFSYFLNSQKFTPCILNSLVLLTISSTLLVIQPEPESSTSNSSSKYNYVIGYICAIGSSAGYSLVLSLTDYAFEKILKKYTFKAILDMVTYQSFVATCAVVVGLFVSGGWKMLRTEMKEFTLGENSYILINIGAMISWQACWIGSVGLILEVSSLFSNVISTLCLPVVPVLAVVFFRDEMSGIKLIAMFLAIWGFVSYAYQHYVDDPKQEDEKEIPQGEEEEKETQEEKINAKQKVLFLRAVMERSQELNVNGDQNLEANLIDHETLVSCCVVLIGLFASGEWKLIASEMRNYRLGKVSYVMTLSSAAMSSQVYTIGAVGLIFESSSVFSNTHYLDEKKLKTRHTNHVEEDTQV